MEVKLHGETRWEYYRLFLGGFCSFFTHILKLSNPVASRWKLNCTYAIYAYLAYVIFANCCWQMFVISTKLNAEIAANLPAVFKI